MTGHENRPPIAFFLATTKDWPRARPKTLILCMGELFDCFPMSEHEVSSIQTQEVFNNLVAIICYNFQSLRTKNSLHFLAINIIAYVFCQDHSILCFPRTVTSVDFKMRLLRIAHDNTISTTKNTCFYVLSKLFREDPIVNEDIVRNIVLSIREPSSLSMLDEALFILYLVCAKDQVLLVTILNDGLVRRIISCIKYVFTDKFEDILTKNAGLVFKLLSFFNVSQQHESTRYTTSSKVKRVLYPVLTRIYNESKLTKAKTVQYMYCMMAVMGVALRVLVNNGRDDDKAFASEICMHVLTKLDVKDFDQEMIRLPPMSTDNTLFMPYFLHTDTIFTNMQMALPFIAANALVTKPFDPLFRYWPSGSEPIVPGTWSEEMLVRIVFLYMNNQANVIMCSTVLYQLYLLADHYASLIDKETKDFWDSWGLQSHAFSEAYAKVFEVLLFSVLYSVSRLCLHTKYGHGFGRVFFTMCVCLLRNTRAAFCPKHSCSTLQGFRRKRLRNARRASRAPL